MQTLPPPVRAASGDFPVKRDSRDAGTLQRRDSRDSGTVLPAGWASDRREFSQIAVPLQVVSPALQEISPPTNETLDLIARARKDLIAPLPPQLDLHSANASQHSAPYGKLAWAVPGSLRCASQAPCLDTALAGTPPALAANGKENAASEVTSLAKLQQERRQLLEWGDGLFQHVGRLEQEKARIEQSASLTRRQLQEEIERLKRGGSELERQANASALSAKENESLRKQLAAYAVEIDSLRDENEKVVKSRHEAQEAVQRLTEEREELRAQSKSLKGKQEVLDDLRQRHRETLSKLEDEARDHTAMKDQGAKARTTLEELNMEVAKERKQSKALANVVKSLQESYAKLQEGFIAQTRDFSQFVARGKEQQRQAHEQLEVTRRESKRQVELIESLLSELVEARQSHGKSCQLWQEHARHQACEAELGAAEAADQRVATERVDAEERLREMQCDFEREREDMKARLADESERRRKLEEELGRKEQWQRERNIKRQRRLGMDRGLLRLERALERNIARDMFELEQGAVLEKVHEKNCRRETRLVTVSPDEMQMRWSKDVRGKPCRSQSHLNLFEVIRIHYGSMARACVIHTELPPWLCFSLHTARRSYDFCCPNEETVQRFVLGLSRLCDCASGTITTRSHFVALCGWCKLEEHCFRREISLGRLFIEAIDRIRDAPGQIGLPHSPSPEPPI